MKNQKINIFNLLIKDGNVNLYTKLLIILSQMDYFNRHYIPNKLIMNRLKTNKKNSIRLINMLKENNIIDVIYLGSKRYFRFKENYKKSYYDDFDNFDYNWLEE